MSRYNPHTLEEPRTLTQPQRERSPPTLETEIGLIEPHNNLPNESKRWGCSCLTNAILALTAASYLAYKFGLYETIQNYFK